MTDQTPLPPLLKNRDRDRLQQYTSALAFYEGKQWPAPEARTRSVRRLTLNYAKAIVNKTATFTMKGAAVNACPHPPAPPRFPRVAHRHTPPREDVIALWGIAPRDKTAEIIEDWTDATLDIWIDGGPTPTPTQVNPYAPIPLLIYPT